jgi:hypothetical protein
MSLARICAVGIAGPALLLAACGGGASSDPGQTQQPKSNGNQQVGVEEFGMTDENLVNSIERAESLIASCMTEAGFDYVPIDPVTFRGAMDALTSAPGLTDSEFVAQYGYGISTLPPTQAFGAGEENTRINEQLSPPDQVAYKRTLWGDNVEATFVIMLENEDFSGAGGCTKKAIDQVFTEEQRNAKYVNPFDAQVQQDSRMVDALEKWSGCMRDAGYDYENPDDAERYVTDRLDAIAKGADPRTLTGSEKAALTQLQGEERAIAQADNDCFEQHVTEVERQVERDISGRN